MLWGEPRLNFLDYKRNSLLWNNEGKCSAGSKSSLVKILTLKFSLLDIAGHTVSEGHDFCTISCKKSSV